MRVGRLSWRVREALKRTGYSQGQARCRAGNGSGNDALERRVEKLEGKLRRGRGEVRTAVAETASTDSVYSSPLTILGLGPA